MNNSKKHRLTHSTSLFPFKPCCASNLECYDYTVRYGGCNMMGTYCHLLAWLSAVIFSSKNWVTGLINVLADIHCFSLPFTVVLSTLVPLFTCVFVQNHKKKVQSKRRTTRERERGVCLCSTLQFKILNMCFHNAQTFFHSLATTPDTKQALLTVGGVLRSVWVP